MRAGGLYSTIDSVAEHAKTMHKPCAADTVDERFHEKASSRILIRALQEESLEEMHFSTRACASKSFLRRH